MATNNPYQHYQANAVQTASPGELTLMLYNGCLKFIKFARQAMETGDIAARNENLIKAQNIILELMKTLNMEYEVAKSMMTMYDYIYRRLVEANVKNDAAILDEVEGHVTEFRDAWKQVIQLHRQRQYAEGGQA